MKLETIENLSSIIMTFDPCAGYTDVSFNNNKLGKPSYGVGRFPEHTLYDIEKRKVYGFDRDALEKLIKEIKNEK